MRKGWGLAREAERYYTTRMEVTQDLSIRNVFGFHYQDYKPFSVVIHSNQSLGDIEIPRGLRFIGIR